MDSIHIILSFKIMTQFFHFVLYLYYYDLSIYQILKKKIILRNIEQALCLDSKSSTYVSHVQCVKETTAM